MTTFDEKVLNAVKSVAGKDGLSSISYAKISNIVGEDSSIPKVQRSINTLLEKGYLVKKVERCGGRATVYRVPSVKEEVVPELVEFMQNMPKVASLFKQAMEENVLLKRQVRELNDKIDSIKDIAISVSQEGK